MAEQMVSVKKTYGAPHKDIVLAPHLAFAIPVQVGNTGVSVNSEGKKIIPAGTPIGGTVSALETRDTILTVTNSSTTGTNAQGILRYEVDVTAGTVNATMLVSAIVDTSKCPTIDASVKTALAGRIVFINGGAY